MSDKLTKKMLPVYESMASPTLFLSGLFQSPASNFYNSEEVEIDVVRYDEEISIVIQDLSTGGRNNKMDLYTNKRFKAPIHKEKTTINSFNLNQRIAGKNPFEDVIFQEVATTKALTAIAQMGSKIKRAIELQASQVLQTGKLDLKDENGVSLYALDYKPKSTHFFTASTTWDNIATATPLKDLETMMDLVRADGKVQADQIIMGSAAFNYFIQSTEVKAALDNRRITLGTISPVAMRSDGGKYQGVLSIGNYMVDLWTYQGFYENPETKATVPYIDPAKVIVRASTARMDATYGAIPRFNVPNAGLVLPFLPPRLSSVSTGVDIYTNAYLTEGGEQLVVSASSRPLMIPTAIDSFGCLDSGV